MMLLYVCKECGHWGDMALAESIGRAMTAFSAALSNKTPEVTPQTYDCPEGHGPMTLIESSHRLMAWNPEEVIVRSLKIAPVVLEPVTQHDGGLDGRDPHNDWHGTVGIQENYGLCDGSHVVEVCGGYGDCENSRILLDPGQALSLLAWLEQEKTALMLLVSEQAEKTK